MPQEAFRIGMSDVFLSWLRFPHSKNEPESGRDRLARLSGAQRTPGAPQAMRRPWLLSKLVREKGALIDLATIQGEVVVAPEHALRLCNHCNWPAASRGCRPGGFIARIQPRYWANFLSGTL